VTKQMDLSYLTQEWATTYSYSIIINLFYISDLKAFERRLTEVIVRLQPATLRWRCKFTHL